MFVYGGPARMWGGCCAGQDWRYQALLCGHACTACLCSVSSLLSPSRWLPTRMPLCGCTILSGCTCALPACCLQAEAREDILRRHGQEIAEEYRRVGLLRAREQRQPEESAPKRRREPPVAGAVVAASKQQQEQQQGAPASDAPTGVLALQQRLQLRGSSSEEHEVEEAAGGEQAAALQAAQAPLLHSRRRRQDAAAAF